MHHDVEELRDFYYRSPLGRAVQRVVRGQLTDIWPEAASQTVAGYGFAVPLLRPYLAEARRVIALMPGPQGVMPWPHSMPNVSVLCEETLWPVQTGFLDKLVILHGLETSPDPALLLEEAYRCLGPGGRMVVIVPNRAGLWSRSDQTPFGVGRPYTMRQLDATLRRHGFQVESQRSTLYQPPSPHRFWRRSSDLMERWGQRIPLLAAGGVLMVEAGKQVPAPVKGVPVRARPRLLPSGLGVPVPGAAATPVPRQVDPQTGTGP